MIFILKKKMLKIKLFGNKHCGSCKKWKPLFERLMQEYNIEYVYIDIEKDEEERLKNNVTAIPVTVFYNDNEEMGRILGSMEEDTARKQIEYYVRQGETQG